jgi:hypothetical protein
MYLEKLDWRRISELNIFSLAEKLADSKGRWHAVHTVSVVGELCASSKVRRFFHADAKVSPNYF